MSINVVIPLEASARLQAGPASTVRSEAPLSGCIIERHASFESSGLQHAWDLLSETCDTASLFNSYLWCRCWFETVGRQAEPVILQILNEHSETIGLCPLCIERRRGVRWLQFMGRDRVSGDHLNLLCAPDHIERCLAALMAYLDQSGVGYDGLILGELEPETTTLEQFIAWANRHRYPYHEREHRVVPFIDLPDTFEAYLTSRSKKRRAHIRRGRKELAQMPGTAIQLDRSIEAASEALDHFFHLHHLRWQQDGLASNYQDPLMRCFLQTFCESLAKRDGLRCYTLRMRGEPQAVLIAFHWKDTAYFYQIGRRPDCPLESPGGLLIAESIEQAIRENLSRYDFLRGQEAYKFYWTSQSVEQTTLVIGQRLPARIAMTTESLKNRVKNASNRCFGKNTWERIKTIIG